MILCGTWTSADMLNLDQLRHETSVAVDLDEALVKKRIAAAGLMGVILFSVGFVWAAISFALAITLSEVSFFLSHRGLRPTEDLMGEAYVAKQVGNNIFSTLVFSAPTLILMTHPTDLVLFTAFLWGSGILVHVSNSRSMLPFYFTVEFATSAAVFSAAIALGYFTHGRSEPVWMVAMTLGGLGVYLSNTMETLAHSRATRHQLEEARRAASARLVQLEFITNHDGLTGLSNRKAFEESLENILAMPPSDTMVAIILLDLDGFKPINDTYSHEAGDTVLRATAHRLSELAGQNAVVARFGGDEFALVAPNVKDRQAALALGQTIVKELKRPIPYDGKSLTVGASVGISLLNPIECLAPDLAALCAQADQAMYRAKSSTDAKTVIYDPADFAPRLSLEDKVAMSQVIRNDTIEPHYQPIYNLQTGRLTGFEALARWRHEDGSLGRPASFLPQIEELALQSDFAYGMVRQVLSDVERLLASGLDPGHVSVNLPETILATHSGRQDLDWLLAEFSHARNNIVFEVTEGVFVSRAAEMIQDALAHFGKSGVRISLDDFGTGYGSLRHLRNLHFDELKIDSSFIAGLAEDPAAEVLIEAFLSIATGLGVTVVAEGVETRQQAEMLRAKGCHLAQGYYFGHAVPYSEVPPLVMAAPVTRLFRL